MTWPMRALALVFFAIVFFSVRAVVLLALAARSRARARSISSVLQSNSNATRRPLRTLVILGSGGHTAEMMGAMDGLDRRAYAPLVFVRAATDHTSATRVQRKEAEKGQHECTHIQIPRSREVGQSYVSSVWTTLVAMVHAARIVVQACPEIMLCNGPGTGVPLCVLAFLCKVFLFRPCRIVFIESFCRVESLSMSGLMLMAFVDEFVVQWPQLDARQARHEKTTATQRGWRGVKYIGRLC